MKNPFTRHPDRGDITHHLRHGNPTDAELARYAVEGDIHARTLIAYRSNLPEEVFMTLRSDPSEEVRKATISNNELPLPILLSFLYDLSPEVKEQARNALPHRHADLAQHLACDPTSGVVDEVVFQRNLARPVADLLFELFASPELPGLVISLAHIVMEAEQLNGIPERSPSEEERLQALREKAGATRNQLNRLLASEPHAPEVVKVMTEQLEERKERDGELDATDGYELYVLRTLTDTLADWDKHPHLKPRD